MTTPTRPPFLRVVEPEPEPAPIRKQDFGGPTGQHTLFANALPNLIVFIHFEKVNESDFLATILNAKPKFILDLRVAPRFDIGSLNRKLTFSVFAQVGARYFDVAGNLGIRSPRDARLNPEIVVGEIRRSILQGAQQVDGPIVILLGQQQSDANYERHIGIQFESLSPIGWELMRVPASVSAAQETRLRDLVFISHANPEDNDFALWLGAKLTLMGYRVWSDLTRLIGGEEFWDDIEEAIRKHSAKVVVCLSRIAQKKKGVLDEIACAVGAERSMGLENFVVPIRIDSLPFSEVRANVGRKNIIDFHGNWAKGLSALVGAFERDAVPRPIENGESAVSLLSRFNASAQLRLIEAEDQLQANWLLVSSLQLLPNLGDGMMG
jgi:hypothetical protein